MALTVNKHREKTAMGWFYRVLFGPAMIIDGIVLFLTIGFISPGLSLSTARAMTKTRMPRVPRGIEPDVPWPRK
jgi:hypothetical protein